jgi:hypothetical protein
MNVLMTYKNCEATFARRRKNSDYKAVLRGAKLTYRKDTDEYVVSYTNWRKETDLASINKDNVLTILADGKNDISMRNRLSWMIHATVYQDITRHRTKESCVRISTWDSQTKTYSLWGEKTETIPLHVGMQFQMSESGHVLKVLHRDKDTKILVKKDKVHKATKTIEPIKQIMVVTMKLGGYDAMIQKILQTKEIEVQDVDLAYYIENAHDLSGYDVENLFKMGLKNTGIPWGTSEYRVSKFKKDALENTCGMLRQRFYEINDGFEKVCVE